MIFKHADIIRLAVKNGRQLYVTRDYHDLVRSNILSKGYYRNSCIKSVFTKFHAVNRRFDTIVVNLQHFSTSQINGCNKNDAQKSSTKIAKKSEANISVKATVQLKSLSPEAQNQNQSSDGLIPLEKSPLEVTTKAGKLIVSAVEDLIKESPKALELAPNQTGVQLKKSIELPTKLGTLLVHATTQDNKLDGIVLEQITKKNEAKTSDNAGAGAAKRERVDFSRSSLERNFITPARAISDFLLKMSDLESLPKTKRRSPYEQEPPIIVYWRKDVEAKAIEKWGSRENLLRECLKREIERKQHQQNIFTVKRRLRDYRREMDQRSTVTIESGLKSRSGRVVVTAIVM